MLPRHRARRSADSPVREAAEAAAGESSDTLTLYLRDVRRTELFTPAGGVRHGHARARRRLRGAPVDDRAQPAAGGQHRQGLPRTRRAAVGPDRGGQPRPDARHRQVRAGARLPLLDLCDLVDPAVGRARGDEPGPRDPPAGARGARTAAGAARAPHARERSRRSRPRRTGADGEGVRVEDVAALLGPRRAGRRRPAGHGRDAALAGRRRWTARTTSYTLGDSLADEQAVDPTGVTQNHEVERLLDQLDRRPCRSARRKCSRAASACTTASPRRWKS